MESLKVKVFMQLNEQFIRSALPDAQISGSLSTEQVEAFSVNADTVGSSDMFVILEREEDTIDQDTIVQTLHTACGVLISRDQSRFLELHSKILAQKFVVLVEDATEALVLLAREWRALFSIPIMAIAGSVGKTSTQKLLDNILKSAGKKYLLSSEHDNRFPILDAALSLLSLRGSHDGALFEVGVTKRGQMEKLAALIKPTTALITNIGHSHMEGIGSLSDVALEKREVFKHFLTDSIGLINGDFTLLNSVSYAHPIIRFGTKTTNQIQARKINVESGLIHFTLKIYKAKYQISINHPHMSAVFNTLAATAAAYYLKIPVEKIVLAIQQPFGISERFELCHPASRRGIIINDACNANPESMKASLLAFQHVETNAPKVAVLGDMLDLGPTSAFWHRQLGRFLRKVPSLQQVVLVGAMMIKWAKKTVPATLNVHIAHTWQEAVPIVKQYLDKESIVLIKGSQDTGLSKITKQLLDQI